MYTVIETPTFKHDASIIWLLVIFSKKVKGNIPAHILKSIQEALQDEWEQGLGQPSGAAKALIQIAFRHPEVIQEEFENQ